MAPFRMLRGVAVLLGLVAGCGGGRSGTGISESVTDLIASQPSAADAVTASEDASRSVLSIISGNVADVRLALRPPPKSPDSRRALLASVLRLRPFASVAHAAGGLDGIRVSVEGTDAATETDPDGFFSLSGPFSGTTTLRFERLDDGIDSTMIVSVPKGGSLSLRDLTIDGGAVDGGQSLSFDGLVDDRNCLRHQLEVVSRFDPTGPSYVVDLAESSVSNDAGDRVYCLEVRKGAPAHVEGTVLPNGTIANGSVVIGPTATTGSTAAAAVGMLPDRSLANPRIPSLSPTTR